jgi:uncharacterized protein (DUF1501 family)
MQTRRQFLASAVGASSVVTFGQLPPAFCLEAAESAGNQLDETVLVVVQLSGGNDGLNTVVPFTDPIYRQHRPTLAVGRDAALKVTDELGLHPAARGLADLHEAGHLCIVQGVGYPNPNRSHFESMDIWHTCQRNDDHRQTGWLGRFLDWTRPAAAAADSLAMHFGDEKQPLALAAQNVTVPSISSLDEFQLAIDDSGKLREMIENLSRAERRSESDLLGFVRQRATSALATSARLQSLSASMKTETAYPSSGLAERLKVIARLIDAGLPSRIYYVALDGFDTHSRQADAHAALLREFGEAVASFIGDVNARGHGQRVIVMGFSEFGRRVAENASEGTDHGAAAPMFLAGQRVKPGLVGTHPSLEDLEDGDIKFQIDFRRVYAGLLEDWLGCPSDKILGRSYEPLQTMA